MKLTLVACFLFAFIPAQASDGFTKLKNEVQVTCQPGQTFFCSNMHVSCAGKTNVPTFPFTLQTKEKTVELIAPTSFEVFNQLYSASQVQWGVEALYAVVTPADSTGYIKIYQNGNYEFRYYPSKQSDGIMSLGKCE